MKTNIFHDQKEAIFSIVRLWMLRTLFNGKYLSSLLVGEGESDDHSLVERNYIFNFIRAGIRHDEDASMEKFYRIAEIAIQLEGRKKDIDMDDITNANILTNSEKKKFFDLLWYLEENPPQRTGPFFDHLHALSTRLQLNPIETDIVLLAALIRMYPLLKNYADIISKIIAIEDQTAIERGADLTFYDMIELVAILLKTSADEVAKALRPENILTLSGLFDYHSYRHVRELEDWLDLGDTAIRALQFGLTSQNPDQTIKYGIKPVPYSAWTLADFPHLQDAADVCHPLLQRALTERLVGVNILFYGECCEEIMAFMEALAKSLDSELWRLYDNRHREYYESYQIGQRLLHRKNGHHLMVVEGFHNSGSRSWFSREQFGLSEMMTTNSTPTLWVFDEMPELEPVVLEQLTLVWQLSPASPEIRQAMFTKQLQGLPVSSEWMERITSLKGLTLSLITQAIRTLETMNLQKQDAIEHTLERIILNQLGGVPQPPHKDCPLSKNACNDGI